MFTILWNEGPAKGSTDLIPQKWFSKRGLTIHRQHKVSCASSDVADAFCDCKVDGRFADLDYNSYRKENVEQGMDLGIMRLCFSSADRSKIDRVEWKGPKWKKFRQCNVKLGRVDNNIATRLTIFDSPDTYDDEIVKISVRKRRGQPKFRNKLLKVYAGKCAVSECAFEGLLEAAHIQPHSKRGDNSVKNGILLRADLHTLFDLGLLKINPRTRMVVISPSISDPVYTNFRNKIIFKPSAIAHQISAGFLQKRWKMKSRSFND